jgi:hypothetical protein
MDDAALKANGKGVTMGSHEVKGPVSPSDATATRLEEMGYKQELTRSLGMVSVLGLSFAIMAVPFGTSTTLNIALTDGGPVTILWGVSGSVRDQSPF